METLLATFDDPETAQKAIAQLLANGFDRANVHSQQAWSEQEGASSTTGDRHEHTSGFIEFFKHLFGTSETEEQGYYSEAVRRGAAVVAVDAPSEPQLQKAQTILQGFGPIDMNQRAEQWRQSGWSGFDPDAAPISAEEQGREGQAIPVIREDLQVGKRAIDNGSVRVVKRVSETPVTQVVPLRQERASIVRRPVDRAATAADFKETVVEVRESEEQPVVGKTARVVEEVTVGKEATEHEEKVSDTVRRTDVEVQRVEPGTQRARPSGAPPQP